MINILLLEDYQGNKAGKTIEVDKNVAHGLIDKGIGKPVQMFKKDIQKPVRNKQIKKPNRRKCL
jgi:hypothetical protein